VPKGSTLLLFVLTLAAIVPVLFIWLPNINPSIPNASAVTAADGIGVYWNQAATNSCRSINWGNLTPGSRKTMLVYIKNESNESMFYLIATERWDPINAASYMVLKSNYNGTKESPGSVQAVSLTLSVSPAIHGIVDFSFDVVIRGSRYLWGDVNRDGTVDGKDLSIIAEAYSSNLNDPDWNPDADINGDGSIDGKDLSIAAKVFGMTSA